MKILKNTLKYFVIIAAAAAALATTVALFVYLAANFPIILIVLIALFISFSFAITEGNLDV